MAGKSKRARLQLADAQRDLLKARAKSRTAPVREVERSRVLLSYAEGTSISAIQREVGVSRPSIYKCIDKAIAAGVLVA
ncbi:MAG: helix-turn-helix domain-containing protein, partial [Pseudomonadota bacterium]|nr:helix-turn-helix domain-containing protein [Pseudomonadota bacterium]